MPELPDLHTLPVEWHPNKAFRNNGPHDLVLERYKLRELAEGWPCYRDACEWENLRSLFHPDAYVYTTWTGRTHYRDFITASQEGMDKGAFILHRCHGLTTDINPEATRAVTKMKATITQRFRIDNCEVDAESDCRFCFFWNRNEEGEWRAKYVRHWYEKDKMIPVTAGQAPDVNYDQLMQYPSGYRHLAYLQERTMNVQVVRDMPGHRRENGLQGGSQACGEKHDLLYQQCKAWVEGMQIDM